MGLWGSEKQAFGVHESNSVFCKCLSVTLILLVFYGVVHFFMVHLRISFCVIFILFCFSLFPEALCSRFHSGSLLLFSFLRFSYPLCEVIGY